VGSAGIVGGVTEETARPLGEWLRQRREELGISLEQAEADTRIRARYLQALEAEDLDTLPDPIVGRGFLRNYASYLGLGAEEAAARFAEFGAPPPPEPLSAEDVRSSSPEPFRPLALHDMPGFRSRRGWVIGLVAVLLVTLALGAWWGAPHIIAFWNWAMPAARPTATREIVSTTPPTATLTASPAVETRAPTAPRTEATPTLEPTLTVALTPSPSATPSRPVYMGIFLELVLTDTSWIQVSVDGVRQFQGELENGTYRSWYGEERVELRIGNAGAVLVTVNGQSLGALGSVGDVVDRVFEKVGESVTEATITAEPSGTVTITVTSTPRPTRTQPPSTDTPVATSPAEGTETSTPEPDTPTPEARVSPAATFTPIALLVAKAGP
jgi:cytoskeleton protein RodZ